MAEGDTRISVIISKDLKAEFEKLCKLERRSMSAQIVTMIEQAVKAAQAADRI